MKIIKTAKELIESKRFKSATNNIQFTTAEINNFSPLLTYIINKEGLQKCAYGTMIDIVLYNSSNCIERYCKLRENPTSRSYKAYILRYGENEGNKRWNIYKNKQSISNSFEYKQKI